MQIFIAQKKEITKFGYKITCEWGIKKNCGLSDSNYFNRLFFCVSFSYLTEKNIKIIETIGFKIFIAEFHNFHQL